MDRLVDEWLPRLSERLALCWEKDGLSDAEEGSLGMDINSADSDSQINVDRVELGCAKTVTSLSRDGCPHDNEVASAGQIEGTVAVSQRHHLSLTRITSQEVSSNRSSRVIDCPETD